MFSSRHLYTLFEGQYESTCTRKPILLQKKVLMVSERITKTWLAARYCTECHQTIRNKVRPLLAGGARQDSKLLPAASIRCFQGSQDQRWVRRRIPVLGIPDRLVSKAVRVVSMVGMRIQKDIRDVRYLHAKITKFAACA